MDLAEKWLHKIPHPDLIEISPEKNSIKIEPIRDLLKRLSLKPFGDGRIVVIIENAEMLTENAANALLKTLEEPPPYAVFILITPSGDSLLPTIRSRCQKIQFQISTSDLKQNFKTTFADLNDREKFFALYQRPSFSKASQLAESWAKESDQIDLLLSWLKILWHDLIIHSTNPDSIEKILPHAEIEPFLQKKNTTDFFEQYDLLLETERALKGNVNKTLALERLLMTLCGLV